jgi:hypothetical protein
MYTRRRVAMIMNSLYQVIHGLTYLSRLCVGFANGGVFGQIWLFVVNLAVLYLYTSHISSPCLYAPCYVIPCLYVLCLTRSAGTSVTKESPKKKHIKNCTEKTSTFCIMAHVALIRDCSS